MDATKTKDMWNTTHINSKAFVIIMIGWIHKPINYIFVLGYMQCIHQLNIPFIKPVMLHAAKCHGRQLGLCFADARKWQIECLDQCHMCIKSGLCSQEYFHGLFNIMPAIADCLLQFTFCQWSVNVKWHRCFFNVIAHEAFQLL